MEIQVRAVRELAERLRAYAATWNSVVHMRKIEVMRRAADALEAQAARVEELEREVAFQKGLRVEVDKLRLLLVQRIDRAKAWARDGQRGSLISILDGEER